MLPFTSPRLAATSVYRHAFASASASTPTPTARPLLRSLALQQSPHLIHVKPTTARMFATSRVKPGQAKTYSLQPTLPRLPVPELEKSLEGYLKSLVPVLEQKVCSVLY